MRRIGVLVPAGNFIHEREFAALAPEGVSFRFAEFPYPSAGSGFCVDLLEAVAAPIESLGKVDQLLFGCATASVLCPHIGAPMAALAGAPVVLAAQASVAALKRAGARSVALATPYGAAVNQTIVDFLAGHGIATAGVAGLNFDAQAMSRAGHTPEAEVLSLALSADRVDAEAIYLPCTAVGTLGVLAAMEARTGKPAISSILAGFQALDL